MKKERKFVRMNELKCGMRATRAKKMKQKKRSEDEEKGRESDQTGQHWWWWWCDNDYSNTKQ